MGQHSNPYAVLTWASRKWGLFTARPQSLSHSCSHSRSHVPLCLHCLSLSLSLSPLSLSRPLSLTLPLSHPPSLSPPSLSPLSLYVCLARLSLSLYLLLSISLFFFLTHRLSLSSLSLSCFFFLSLTFLMARQCWQTGVFLSANARCLSSWPVLVRRAGVVNSFLPAKGNGHQLLRSCQVQKPPRFGIQLA